MEVSGFNENCKLHESLLDNVSANNFITQKIYDSRKCQFFYLMTVFFTFLANSTAKSDNIGLIK